MLQIDALNSSGNVGQPDGRNGLIDTRFWALVGIVLAAAASRLLPHPHNVTPVFAVALFGGAYFANRWAAFAVPLAAMFISDVGLVVTQYGWSALRSQPIVYLNMAFFVVLGVLVGPGNRLMSGISHDFVNLLWAIFRCISTVFGAMLLGTMVFFITTNFAVWYGSTMYPQTPDGLLTCYVAALPFLRNMLLGNAAFTALFFGGFALAESRFGWLRPKAAPVRVPA